MTEEALNIADQNEDKIFTLLFGDKINNVQFEVRDAAEALVKLDDGDFGLRIKDFFGDGSVILAEYKASEADTGNAEITTPSTGIMQWYVDPDNFPTAVGHDCDRVMEFFFDDNADGEEKLGRRALRIKG